MRIRYVTVPEMLEIERAADAGGLSYAEMMENAGRGLAEKVAISYSHEEKGGVLALVGKGNNGGDALVALTYLAEQGWSVCAYVIEGRPDDDPLIERLREGGGEIIHAEDDSRNRKLRGCLAKYAVLLDGLLGTGIKLPLRGPFPKLLDAVGRILDELEQRLVVVAVDCPSGMDCDSGEVAVECLPADVTVCMAAVKRGMLRLPAFAFLGELEVVDIGLPEGLKPWKAVKRGVVDEAFVAQVLPPRPLDAHKGTFGTALVVAGSTNYTGAALLAGEAAYRVGAGLVTLAVPTPLHAALAGQLPEATWLLLPHETGVIGANAAGLLRQHLERATAMLLGPGFGMEETTGDFLARLLTHSGGNRGLGFVAKKEVDDFTLPPLVIDADGLKLLARLEDWPELLPKPAVLTPHPGEMAVLTGLGTEEIQADRIGVAERYAKKWGHVVVLKGAFTVIASPDGNTAILPVAHPALARAGTGDVLAGLIVGLRAQGVEAFDAAAAGAWLHAKAGLAAAEYWGTSATVLAGDLLGSLGEVLADVYPED